MDGEARVSPREQEPERPMTDGGMTAATKARALRELFWVYAWTALVTVLVSYSDLPLTRLYGHVMLAAVFLGTTLYMARKNHVPLAHYGADLSGLLETHTLPNGELEPLAQSLRRALPEMLRELGFALGFAALLFPPFVLAFRVWHRVEVPFTLHIPHDPWDFVLGQLIVVALPEEALFRGYFQTRLSELFPRTRRVLGVPLSLAVLSCQATLFALLHFLVGRDPSRFAVFFPALVFGFLRVKRGGIGAAIWFHAFCNLLSEVLARGYL
jgi:membrane protease YdiL (CAAX protease family)